MIKLGDKVKDSVTGFVGVATARAEYMNGCIQYEITPNGLIEGKVGDSYWMDEQRVSKVPKGKSTVKKTVAPRRRRGGPQNRPPGMSRPAASAEKSPDTW